MSTKARLKREIPLARQIIIVNNKMVSGKQLNRQGRAIPTIRCMKRRIIKIMMTII